MEISLCMIVKNEVENLRGCLDSVEGLFDEIIVVDTGSDDKTKEVALRYTDKVYDFKWVDDFSMARNYSFSMATRDYIIWLDADDIITGENKKKLLDLKKTLSSGIDVVFMPYDYIVDKGKTLQTCIRERIVKKSAGLKWTGEIHENIDCQRTNKLYNSDVTITHTKRADGTDKSTRNLSILENIIKKGSASLKMVFYYACELDNHNRQNEAIRMFEIMFANGGYTSEYCLDAFMTLYDLYIKKSDYRNARQLCVDCAPYCKDRSEFCCTFGDFYHEYTKDIDCALSWYSAALGCRVESDKFTSTRTLYYYCIPYLRLGRMYELKNDEKRSFVYIKKALEYCKNKA